MHICFEFIILGKVITIDLSELLSLIILAMNMLGLSSFKVANSLRHSYSFDSDCLPDYLLLEIGSTHR